MGYVFILVGLALVIVPTSELVYMETQYVVYVTTFGLIKLTTSVVGGLLLVGLGLHRLSKLTRRA